MGVCGAGLLPEAPLRPRPPLARLVLSLALLFSSLAASAATTPCLQEYRSALTAVRSAHLGRGLEQKLTTKLDNAWRKYAALSKNGPEQAARDVQNALDLLDSNATKQIPPSLVTAIRNAITSFSGCLKATPAPQSGTVTVRTFLLNPSLGGAGASAGSGVSITVDGEEFARTGTDGTATVRILTGTSTIVAQRYGNQAGSAVVSIDPGQALTVDIVLTEDKEIGERGDVAADEVLDSGVLPQNFQTLTLRLSRDGSTIAVKKIASAELRSAGESFTISDQFTIGGSGEVRLVSATALRDLVDDRVDPFEVRLHLVDASGNSFYETVPFAVGRYALDGSVTASSVSGLNTGGLYVLAVHSQSGLAFRTTTDASGAFHFTNLPEGQYQVSTEAQQGSVTLHADQPVVLVANGTVTLRLNTFADLVDGATPVTGKALTGIGAIAAQGIAATAVSSGAPRLQRIHSALFEIDGSQFRALDHVTATLPEPLESLSEDQLKASELRTLLGGSSTDTFVTVTAYDENHVVVFRDVVAVAKYLRGEYPAADGTQTHLRAPRRLSFEIRVPIEGRYVRLTHGDLVADFDLDAIVTDSALVPYEQLARSTHSRMRSDGAGVNVPNRVDLVIIGDGYQTEALFNSHVDNFLGKMFQVSPYKEYAAYINVYRQYVFSPGTHALKPKYQKDCKIARQCCNDTAAPPQTQQGDMIFGAAYCTEVNTWRSLQVNFSAIETYLRNLNPPVLYDQIIAIVNDSEYGGTGGQYSTISANVDAGEVAIHEFGHSFTKLADEYPDAYDYPDCSDATGAGNPCEPNVTNLLNCSTVKWAPWVNTPQCPTTSPGFIGEYTGARYHDSGYYRPEFLCEMRYLKNPFCAVCKQAFVQRLYNGGWGGRVTPIVSNSASPSNNSPVNVAVAIGQTFSVGTDVPASTVGATWFVNNVAVPNVRTTSYRFVPNAEGTYQLKVQVRDETPLVQPSLRSAGMQQELLWTVVATKQSQADATATASGLDPVRTTQTLIVPAGVTKIRLNYRVTTQETTNRCAGCVDSWLVAVGTAPNVFYFYRSGSISSGPDVTDSQVIDITGAQTPNGATLQLVVEAKNNGDVNNPTTVTASISFETFDPCRTTPPQPDCLQVQINTLTALREPYLFDTKGDGTFFSIPRQGAKNNLQRRLLMTMRVTPATTPFKLDLTLLDADGNTILPILQNVDSTNSAITGFDEIYNVRATFAAPSPSSPAALTHTIKYKVRVSITSNGKTVEDTAYATLLNNEDNHYLHALWRMPDGMARFNPTSGTRPEVGGDDWTSAGTYAWLDSHRGLVTAIDDISGEHAYDMGHPDHGYGSDFDMFYFRRMNVSDAAIDQFLSLRTAVELAMQGQSTQPAAFQAAADWVRATRTGLDGLLDAGGSVQQIRVGSGDVCAATPGVPASSLPANWMRDLLTIGRITDSQNRTLDLGVGLWGHRTDARMLYDCAVNDRVAVQLSRCVMGEGGCGPRRRAVRPTAPPPAPPSTTIQLGQSATLSIAATGEEPIFYQWYAGSSGDASRPIAGAITPSVTVSPTGTSNYWVSVYNYGGTANSPSATVTVVQPCTPAQLTSQSQSATIIAGQTTTLHVGASGSQAIRYLWYIGETGDVSHPLYAAQSDTLFIAPSETTSFWARAWNDCGSVSTSTITITVKPPCVPPSITTQPAPVSIIEGQTATLSVVAAGTAVQYQWFQSDARTGPFSPIGGTSPSVSVSPLVTTYYLVRLTGECGNAESVVVAVTVTPACKPPVITAQPSSTSITEGEPVTLSVAATGTSPQYQWFTGARGDTSTPVPNASSTSLTVTPLATTTYWARVSNDCGTADSAAATIVVSPACTAPVITQQPQGSTINPGQTVTLIAAVTGSSLSYQWYAGVAGDTSTPIINANGTSIVVAPDATTHYWMRALNTCGIADTVGVTVTVTPSCVAPSIVTPPQSTSIVEGQIATLSVVADGTALQYQWFAGVTGNTSQPVGNGTSSSVAVSPGVTTSYWVRISNACGAINSPAASVMVSQTCSGATVSAATQSVNSPEAGAVVTLNANGIGGTAPLQYQWFASAPAGSPFLAMGGRTQQSLDVAPAATSEYFLRVSNACGTADSGVITVIVPQPPTCSTPSITSQPHSQAVPTGSQAVLTVGAGGTQPFTYQWYIGDSGVTTSPVPNSNSATLVVTVNATTKRWVRVSNACGAADSQTATLTATTSCTSPSIYSQPQSVTIAPGQSMTLSVGASGSAPLSYQWYLGDGTRMSGANGSSVTVTPSQTTGFYVIVTNDCGTLASDVVTVTVSDCVKPAITTQPLSQTVAYHATFTLSVVATGQAPLSYRWYNGERGDTTAPLFENGVPATKSTVTIQATTTTKYWVRITNACGTIDSNAALITMLACENPVITQQPQSVTITQGQSATLSVAATTGPGTGTLSYQWYQTANNDFPTPVNGGTSSTLTISPSQTTSYYVYVTNSCGLASSESAIVFVNASCTPPSITQNPQPVTINAGQSATLSAGASGSPSPTYQWFDASDDSPVSGSSSSGSFTVSPSQTTTYYAIAHNACGDDRSNDATVTVVVCNPPVVTSPAAPVYTLMRDGLTKTLTVVATGTAPLTYQWFAEEPEGTGFVAIPGANGPSVVVSPSDVSRYFCRVSNACGTVDSPQWRVKVWDGIGDPPDPVY